MITKNEIDRIIKSIKSIKWLAEQLGVSVTTTSRWCSNSAQPDLSTLVKIASLLDVDIKDLIISTKK